MRIPWFLTPLYGEGNWLLRLVARFPPYRACYKLGVEDGKWVGLKQEAARRERLFWEYEMHPDKNTILVTVALLRALRLSYVESVAEAIAFLSKE